MKLADLIKKGSLTEPARKCSESSKCSRSNTLEGSPSVASTLINKINKSSSISKGSYTYPLNGEDRTGTYKPVATATPAIPATDQRPLPVFEAEGALVPYTVNSYPCPLCGKELTAYYPQGSPLRTPCWNCLKTWKN